jgi:hypothetical protein
MIPVQGRSALWVVEMPKLEMFWAEAVFYSLKRNRHPLAGVIAKEGKRKDGDYSDVGNHGPNDRIIFL